MKDTAQLAIFIRGVTAALQVYEKFLQPVPLHGTTTGQDIFDAVLQCVKQHSLGPVPSRVRDDRRCQPPQSLERRVPPSASLRGRRTHPAHPQGALHHFPQESLCSKSANLTDVMFLVVKIVKIHPLHSLNHRQFPGTNGRSQRTLWDLLYFCEVRWLSHGAMLGRVCEPAAGDRHLPPFQKNLPGADHFSNPQWLARLALLKDITTHLNDINVKLQGKNILVTDMYSHITAFEVKLRLWEAPLAAGQLMHFPRIVACAPDDVDLNTCVGVVTSLREEFASRFTGVRPLAPASSCSPPPLTSLWTKAPAPLQMELVELQCNDELKASTVPLLHCRSSVTSSSLLTNFQITLSM
ncbi:General transcription factor II-I repeat domain-containing protein 2B [Chionoecetes opilio]|uniref:General transcription factor II-I repeat domain-containing protein 2B n=1 Tax=Chionoecetes opilio TaxID=41210 RepID=A0A8J5CIP8_CHIOP|nr:General transcription factor II-I repeat domain-containing protein 2B [Chionoecetes opilio]